MTQQKFNKILRLQTLIFPKQKVNIISKTIFWNCVTRSFRYLYVNCFTRLGYFAEDSTKLKIMHLLDNLGTITQEENMEIREMTAIFFIYFFSCNCGIHFWIWKYSKFIFMLGLDRLRSGALRQAPGRFFGRAHFASSKRKKS